MDFIASARSNYFRTKDPEAFIVWAAKRHLTYHTHDVESDRFFSIDAGEYLWGWPDCDDDGEEFDMFVELQKQLDPRDIAVLISAGSEGARFVAGYSVAVHADGRMIDVSLDDIYERAREQFGPEVRITKARAPEWGAFD